MGDPDATLVGPTDGSTSEHAFAIGIQAAGRYRIERYIAAGAMGEVYGAEDLVVGASVALKVLRAELASSAMAIERLRREIALARKVTNPHVCRLHDVGEHEGRVFLTMELLDGRTLADYVREAGPLPVDEVARIAAQLVDGLGALHAAGIVHRDFKTANAILVGDRAVITDFGLARSVDGGNDGLTVEATLLGTPAYMAPEQVEGRLATPASDVYALGIVLYELLTGRVPFHEDTALATATARLHKVAPRISASRPDVPARWDAIVSCCLARDPADRFARIEDVLVGTTRRRFPWLVLGGATVVAAVMIAVLAGDRSTPAPTGDATCPTAASKLVGVWDPSARARVASRFESSDKPFVRDMWRAHARQFDALVDAWQQRWTATCASDERATDLLLFAQRQACLDAQLLDLRSYISAFADPSSSVDELARASPGEYPLDPPSRCDNIALLRAQLPPPPSANREAVDRLMTEANLTRAKLRNRGGPSVTAPLVAKLADLERGLLRLEYPTGAGDIGYWRIMFLVASGRFIEADAAASDLVVLAERTRDDSLLVRALATRLHYGAQFQPDYDIAAGDATLTRATEIAKRIGDDASLRHDIEEARVTHAARAGRRDQMRDALAAQATISREIGRPYMALGHRYELADLADDVVAYRQIVVESERLVGATNLNLGVDLLGLAKILGRTGDPGSGLDAARRAITIYDGDRGDKVSSQLYDAHRAAFHLAIQASQIDAADKHARAAIASRMSALGESALASWGALVTDLTSIGRLMAARRALELARPVEGNAGERAALAVAEIEIAFVAGDRLDDPEWPARIAAHPTAALSLALIDARTGRTTRALARLDAMTGDQLAYKKPIVRARILLAAHRPAEAASDLARVKDTVMPNERFASGRRQRLRALLGLALVESGRFADAIEPLEQLGSGDGSVFGHEARFAFARALVVMRKDPVRARKLAEGARRGFAVAGLADRITVIDRWLAEHP